MTPSLDKDNNTVRGSQLTENQEERIHEDQYITRTNRELMKSEDVNIEIISQSSDPQRMAFQI